MVEVIAEINEPLFKGAEETKDLHERSQSAHSSNSNNSDDHIDPSNSELMTVLNRVLSEVLQQKEQISYLTSQMDHGKRVGSPLQEQMSDDEIVD